MFRHRWPQFAVVSILSGALAASGSFISERILHRLEPGWAVIGSVAVSVLSRLSSVRIGEALADDSALGRRSSLRHRSRSCCWPCGLGDGPAVLRCYSRGSTGSQKVPCGLGAHHGCFRWPSLRKSAGSSGTRWLSACGCCDESLTMLASALFAKTSAACRLRRLSEPSCFDCH